MARLLIKRKHTDDHPAVYVTMNGKLRNEILLFMKKKGGVCPLDEYLMFIKSLRVKLRLSYEPNGWHKRFTKYIREVNTPEGTHLKLTRLGNNFVNIVLSA